MTHPQPAPHPPLPIQQALPPTGRDHRAIGVSLTTVKSGAGRPSPGTQVGRSDVMTACSVAFTTNAAGSYVGTAQLFRPGEVHGYRWPQVDVTEHEATAARTR